MTVEGQFAPDFEDEVVAGAAVTHAGRIMHEPTREAIEGPLAPETAHPTEGGSETSLTLPSSTTGSADPDPQLDLPFDQEADQ